MNILALLAGKKTYIVSLILVLQAGYQYISGDMTLGQATTTVLEGLGLATLRNGVGK